MAVNMNAAGTIIPEVSEAFKTLRTNIRFSSVDKEIRTLAITSAMPEEGKTTVAISLAAAMAEEGKKTLLVEADCRRPMVANRRSLRPATNWLELLYDDSIPVMNAVEPTRQKNFYFLDSGRDMKRPVEILSSKKFRMLVEKLKQEFDIVIFDTPPVGVFIDAAILSEMMDGTLLVIRAGMVDAKKEQEVVAQLKKAKANILGVALNGVRSYSDDYGYYYRDGKKRKKIAKKRAFSRRS